MDLQLGVCVFVSLQLGAGVFVYLQLGVGVFVCLFTSCLYILLFTAVVVYSM